MADEIKPKTVEHYLRENEAEGKKFIDKSNIKSPYYRHYWIIKIHEDGKGGILAEITYADTNLKCCDRITYPDGTNCSHLYDPEVRQKIIEQLNLFSKSKILYN